MGGAVFVHKGSEAKALRARLCVCVCVGGLVDQFFFSDKTASKQSTMYIVSMCWGGGLM